MMADRNQILMEIRGEIENSAPNTKLATIRCLMQRFSTSQRTVEGVLNELGESGMVIRRPGSGWFVAPSANDGLPRIRMVLPNWASENYQQLERSFLRRAEMEGGFTFRSTMQAVTPDFYRQVQADGCDALVLVTPGSRLSASDIVLIASLPVPVVVLHCELGGIGISAVSDNPASGGMMAASCLIRHGHRELALLVTEPPSDSFDMRCRGFREFAELSGARVRVIETGIHIGESYRGICYQALERHLKEHGRDFTGLFLGSSSAALEVYKFFSDHKIAIPADVSVIGHDRLASNEFLSPPLACIGTDPEEIADAVISGLFRVFSGECAYFHTRAVSHLLERQSVCSLNSQP